MMPSLPCFKFRFTPSWSMLILALLFFSLFVRLGFWQIHRADEKTKMIVAQKTQERQKPVPWTAKKKLPLQYERIVLKGRYLPQVFYWITSIIIINLVMMCYHLWNYLMALSLL